ncbi:hypothetical protein HHK36_023816 [Tetracentron sinense]|uniref:Uncharacterized protein n=1 Tax=Tetracentron sinense TaxID=13715 RepID=A0A834YQX0_TETSI|nr:hypothetical protein HHK36_023816 [Tetracentron sinense]
MGEGEREKSNKPRVWLSATTVATTMAMDGDGKLDFYSSRPEEAEVVEPDGSGSGSSSSSQHPSRSTNFKHLIDILDKKETEIKNKPKRKSSDSKQ